jgi:hypothetical protein
MKSQTFPTCSVLRAERILLARWLTTEIQPIYRSNGYLYIEDKDYICEYFIYIYIYGNFLNRATFRALLLIVLTLRKIQCLSDQIQSTKRLQKQRSGTPFSRSKQRRPRGVGRGIRTKVCVCLCFTCQSDIATKNRGRAHLEARDTALFKQLHHLVSNSFYHRRDWQVAGLDEPGVERFSV